MDKPADREQAKGNGGNGKPSLHPTIPGRNAQGQYLPGVSGNPKGPPPFSPLGRLFRLFVETAAQDEFLPIYREALEKEIRSSPAEFMRDVWNRTPKEVQTAILAGILLPQEQAGLVKKFEVTGAQDTLIDAVHEALTRAVEGTASGPPSRG